MTSSSVPDTLLAIYRRSEIVMVRGDGVMLYDEDGKDYLDFGSGIAACSLGHNHPAMVNALREQGSTLWHCSNIFRNQPLEAFAEKLINACFADQVFFCSSGTEAVEAAIKTIRRYHYSRGNPEKIDIIVMDGAFHGRSTGALSACTNAQSKKGFGPLLPGFVPCAFNDIDALQRVITATTAAIMLEPVQGEGGVRVHDDAYLQQVRALCDAHGLLLFLDEIQCGYGRTGQLFAHESAGITPDILTSAKGIGGGFPLAAMLTTRAAGAAMTQGTHGSTYGSNPLACAVGLAVLNEILADGFLAHVRQMGEQLHTMLTEIVQEFPQLFMQVRGRGLMQGLVLSESVDKYALNAVIRQHGLIVCPAVTPVIRVLPPLIVQPEHITRAQHLLQNACHDFTVQL